MYSKFTIRDGIKAENARLSVCPSDRGRKDTVTSIWVYPPEFAIKNSPFFLVIFVKTTENVRIKRNSRTFSLFLKLLLSNYVRWWTKIWSKSKRSPGNIISGSVITRVAISRCTDLELPGDSVILCTTTCDQVVWENFNIMYKIADYLYSLQYNSYRFWASFFLSVLNFEGEKSNFHISYIIWAKSSVFNIRFLWNLSIVKTI